MMSNQLLLCIMLTGLMTEVWSIPDGDLRLVGGRCASEGRLEVWHGGRWGTIGTDYFTNTAATVACKQMGYNYGHIKATPDYDDIDMWLENVLCNGAEAKLKDCYHKPWGDHWHYWHEIIELKCLKNGTYDCEGNFVPKELGFRLSRPDNTCDKRGRLEISHAGLWGTVCKDYFNDMSATVACRELGYAFGYVISVQPGTGPIYLDDVFCNVLSESLMQDCSRTLLGSHNCRHRDDVGIECIGFPGSTDCNENVIPHEGDLRLQDGACASEGRLEVAHNGRWGTVCKDYFTDTAATVACRQMGYEWGYVKDASPGSGLMWLNAVICNPGEDRLEDCKHSSWGRHCDHRKDVGVVCLNVTGTKDCDGDEIAEEGALRLVDGSGECDSQGRLKVSHHGRWGTICSDYFTDTAATVACRQMGYQYGYVKPALPGSGKIWLDDVICHSTSMSRLEDCSHKPWGSHYCTNDNDVGVECLNVPGSSNCDGDVIGEEGELRLRGSQDCDSQGRLEISHHGRWGTICSDYFTDTSAIVACKQMGYQYGYVKPAIAGTGKIWLDDVICHSTAMSNLVDCYHTPWGEHSCRHEDDVGIECLNITGSMDCDGDVIGDEGELRLRDGISDCDSEGRLEVSHHGRWGTICSDYFTDTAATVACKQMGYQYGYVKPAVPGTGKIWLDDVVCHTTSMSHLEDCSHKPWGKHYCTHNKDIGIECLNITGSLDCGENPIPKEGELRLRGGAEGCDSWGRLEIAHLGRWGTVCKDYFTDREATVACRQMGYQFGYLKSATIGTGPIWLDNVQCGSESVGRLDKCTHQPWGNHDCYHTNDVGIQCIGANGTQDCNGNKIPNEGELRLQDGAGNCSSQGRLEIGHNGRWGTVCKDYFSDTAATVACRQMHFQYGYVKQATIGTGPIWLDDVSCYSTSIGRLEDCYHTLWGVHDCYHEHDIGVECLGDPGSFNCAGDKIPAEGDLRLKDGNCPSQGRLEIAHNGRWGTICNDYFNDNDALVACRQMGFQYGYIKEAATGAGPIWLDNVHCNPSSATRLSDCYHRPLGVHDCSHYHDVGVQCFDGIVPSNCNVTGIRSDVDGGKGNQKEPADGKCYVSSNRTYVCTCRQGLTGKLCNIREKIAYKGNNYNTAVIVSTILGVVFIVILAVVIVVVTKRRRKVLPSPPSTPQPSLCKSVPLPVRPPGPGFEDLINGVKY